MRPGSSRRERIAAACAVLALLAALSSGACSDPPAPPPVVLRLWKGQAAEDAARRANEAGVPTSTGLLAAGAPGGTAVGAVAGGEAARGATPAETTLYATHFDGADAAAQAWFRVVEDKAAGGLRLLPFVPAGGKVSLQRGSAWAALTQLPVVPGEALSVAVTVRTPGGVSQEPVPVAALVELRDALPPDARLLAEDVAHLLDSHRHASHLLQSPLGPQAVELRADFVADGDTRFLAVYLLAPFTETPKSALVESLAVTRRPLTAHVAAGGEFPRLQRLEQPGAVRLALDRDEREGLLALPGAHYAFDLGPCATGRRLDLALGMSERAGGGLRPGTGEAPAGDARPGDGARPGQPAGAVPDAIVVQFVARGEDASGAAFRVVHEETLTGTASADEAAWRDLDFDLPASPEQPLLLELSATAHGEDPPLAVFGHPTVRAPRTAGPREAAGPTPTAPPPLAPPNIVLISLDTLRPDRLGCYGGEAGLTPHLDALAASGQRFTQAESTSSYTLPSHGSMLTGQYPAFHGAVDIDDRLDPARSPFLAQLLADAGWVTAAFTGGGYVSPEFGFAVGFDRYSINDPVWALDGLRGRQLLETRSWERAPVQLPLLRRYAAPMIADWIEDQQDGVPFFLFLHTYIVHNYAPDHASLVKRGLLQADGSEAPFNHQDRVAFNDAEGRAAGVAGAAGVLDFAQRDRIVGEYLPYYDATVGMADEFVGGVLAALDRAGLSSRTLVLVTADHGEEFGEHGFFGHGETLFETNTHVPLIVRLPAGTPESVGGRSPAVYDAPISLVDLAPWILRIAGVAPDPRMAVRPPLAPDSLAPPARSQLFIELDTRTTGQLSAVRQGALKLHTRLSLPWTPPGTPAKAGRCLEEAGGSLLFDLATDPGELDDLSGPRAADGRPLAELLRRLHEAADAVHPRGDKGALDLSTLDPETIQNLIALGYLDASGQPVHKAAGAASQGGR